MALKYFWSVVQARFSAGGLIRDSVVHSQLQPLAMCNEQYAKVLRHLVTQNLVHCKLFRLEKNTHTHEHHYSIYFGPRRPIKQGVHEHVLDLLHAKKSATTVPASGT